MMIAYRFKDFWNKAIMFLADSKTFSLDMISGLEAYAISKAHDAKRCRVENSVKMDEYDLPLIEEVYEKIKFIMATQGYKMDNSKATINEANTLHATRNSIVQPMACMIVKNLRYSKVLRLI